MKTPIANLAKDKNRQFKKIHNGQYIHEKYSILMAKRIRQHSIWNCNSL